MGWSHGSEVFDPVAEKMIEIGVPPQQQTEIASALISALRDQDWDDPEESLSAFGRHPAIVEAFARQDITLDDDEEDDAPGHRH